MANNIISMSKIRQIIWLYTQGSSNLSIASKTGVSRNTAKKYLQAFTATGFTFEEINELSDKELEDLFGKSNERPADERLQTLRQCLSFIDKELKRKGVTRLKLWQTYIKENTDGFRLLVFVSFARRKTASFKINRKLNCRYDHGIGKGENLIDFAILYHNCTIGEFLQGVGNFFFHQPLYLAFKKQWRKRRK